MISHFCRHLYAMTAFAAISGFGAQKVSHGSPISPQYRPHQIAAKKNRCAVVPVLVLGACFVREALRITSLLLRGQRGWMARRGPLLGDMGRHRQRGGWVGGGVRGWVGESVGGLVVG